VIRNDIYGRDQRLLVALKAEDKRVAEIPVEHAQPNYSRPSVQLPNSFNTGQSFFDRLFGNPIRPRTGPLACASSAGRTRADAAPPPPARPELDGPHPLTGR